MSFSVGTAGLFYHSYSLWLASSVAYSKWLASYYKTSHYVSSVDYKEVLRK